MPTMGKWALMDILESICFVLSDVDLSLSADFLVATFSRFTLDNLNKGDSIICHSKIA
jgi:hypothetical protein